MAPLIQKGNRCRMSTFRRPFMAHSMPEDLKDQELPSASR